MNYESHRWHPLHALSLTNLLRSFLLIFALNLLKHNRILKPGFCLVMQVWASLFSTSMRSKNLNMKGKKTEYVIMQYIEKLQMVLLNQICMPKALCFVSTALQQT